jgi:hypothetical protein
MKQLSLWELCWGNLKEGSITMCVEVYERKALGMGISMEARFGNLEWACLPGILRDG